MNKSPEFDKVYSNGMVEFVRENYAKSVEILSEAARLEPTHRLTFVSRGSAYLKMNQVDAALADFNRAIEIDPNYSKAFHLRGLAEEKQGDDANALKDFSRAIDIDPEYGAAYHSRATLHTKMGNEDMAMEDVQMVHHLANKNVETFANDNNVWRSQHLKLESIFESELDR